ncbi:MAG: hypothetical protein RH917_04760 [Lacipirellulaceae bacterium]
MKSLLPPIAVGLGVILLLASFLWSTIFPATATWTEEKNARMVELQNNAHKLLYLAESARSKPKYDGPTPEEARAKFDEAKAELDTLKAEFESIRDRPNTVATYLKWIGSGAVLLGAIGVMAARGG